MVGDEVAGVLVVGVTGPLLTTLAETGAKGSSEIGSPKASNEAGSITAAIAGAAVCLSSTCSKRWEESLSVNTINYCQLFENGYLQQWAAQSSDS